MPPSARASPTTSARSEKYRPDDALATDSRAIFNARDLIEAQGLLSKAVKSYNLYARNNEALLKFLDDAHRHSQSAFEEAGALYEEHLRMAREAGDRKGIAAATGSLGNVASILGRYEEARDTFERARAAMHESGNRRWRPPP